MPAPSQSSPYQALYRSCMKEAAAQGRTLMQRLVRRVALSMPARAALAPDPQERKLLTESAQVLMKHEGALCEAYPQALLAEFAQAIAGDLRRGALSFDSLELMGDDQMQESVELVRTQQAVLHAVEAELTQLNALICAVQGLKSVQADRNPLRPEVYVRSLRTVTLQSPVSHGTRQRWLAHLGEALGPELAMVYRELSDMLRKQGVTEAGFNITPSPEVQVPPRAAEAAAVAEREQQASTLLTVRALRRLLSGELDPQAVAPTPAPQRPADFFETVPAAFEALQEMRQVDAVMQRLQQRQLAGGDAAEGSTAGLREAMRAEAKRPGQALGLEVVNLMVENIASDRRLLPPVQQTVRDLEPALLRLALSDPRFFSDKKHPARQFLEQMTQRSLAWQSVDAPGFDAFIGPLQEAVEALNATRTGGAEPFDFALKSLEEAWGEEQKRDRRYREKAVRALLQAEQRNLLAGTIGRELQARPDIARAPREVLQFILGPWSHVIAQARLADPMGDADASGYTALVADLAWSVQPWNEPGAVARLAKILPGLLEKLRRGLATIDYPQAQTQRFLDQLAELHQRVLKPPVDASRPQALATQLSRDELEAMLGEGDGAWLQPSEAQQSGFMETHQSAIQQPLFQATQPGFGETRPMTTDDADLAPQLPPAGLQQGAWVEMLMDGGWSRYQLTWSSPHGTLFMFTGAGGKTQSMTRRLLDKMLKAGTLRLVSAQAVVDGALDAVADAALRNSLDLKL